MLIQAPELFENFEGYRTFLTLPEAKMQQRQGDREEKNETASQDRSFSATPEPTVSGKSAHEEGLLHQRKYSDTPRVALHPLGYAQFRQHRDDGAEMSELVTSLLMNQLGLSDQFELYDRSMVSALFTEKSLILVDNQQAADQSTLEKLPISEFTLTGSLFSSAQGNSYSLKLIDNSTGQILGAKTFHYTLDDIQQSTLKSMNFVHEILAKAKSSRFMKDAGEMNKISFGHFVEIGDMDSKVNQGREITQRLIDSFVKQKDKVILSRTQLFPLVFEEFLRMLQFTDENQNTQRTNANYFIHGKYRFEHSEKNSPLSVYLYIDTIGYDRKLMVLKAKNWDAAFDLIEDAIVKIIPGPETEIPPDNIEESKQLFLEALKARGMLYDKRRLSGDLPPETSEFRSFASSYKPENIAPTRRLIERSLEANPHNQAAKLALAMFYKADGEDIRSHLTIEEVSRSRDAASVDSAFKLLNKEKSDIASGITAEIFKDIAGPDQARLIYQSLLEEGYLKSAGKKATFNRQKNSYQVFNRSHTLSLRNLDADTSIQAFEKLRSIYYTPGYQVKLLKPRRFNSKHLRDKKNWSQLIVQGKHNVEAMMHFDLASTVSNIHIIKATSLPSVDFYRETETESNERRLSNLEMAVDGFSSSVYLDTSYLEAAILLGHSLCQKEISRCPSGNFIHSWVVDQTKAINLKGREGMYFNVTEEVNERDRMIFLAADAVGRVAEASLTELFQTVLIQEDYLIKKNRKMLQTLLANSLLANSLLANKETPLSEKNRQRLIYAYVKLLRAHCVSLAKFPRNLRRPKKYTEPMESLATIARESDSALSLRKRLLVDLETDYPSIYPYLIVNSNATTPFVEAEQDEMVDKVTSSKVIPFELSKFMKTTLKIFDKRIASGNIEVAKQYIQYYADYYGIDQETAMDFSYLYHRIGDKLTSQRLLKEYGKDSFRINNFTLGPVNGNYRHNGFESGGQLRFTNTEDKTQHIVYKASDTTFGLGEMPVKWRLYSGTAISHRGNRNPKQPNLFAFGNGGKLTGEQVWSSALLPKSSTDAVTGKAPEVFVEVAALKRDDASLSNRSILPKNSVEHLFREGYRFDANQRTAIKGYPRKSTAGPLQDAYFSSSFSKTRRISAVKEQLYEKGYLTVSGLPKYSKRDVLRDDVKKDFPGYSDFERKNLVKALIAAKRIDGSGSAEIYRRKDDIWEQTSTLIPEDAISERAFGLASAVHEEYALVCDYKDGIYSYKKTNNQWVQQQRIESRCNQIAMNHQWAIVTSREQITVYKNNNGSWTKTQALMPDNYLLNKDKGHHFRYFGSSLAILQDNIYIGNPGGGANRRGEVYIFSLSNHKWLQTDILRPNETISQFGQSIAVTNDFMVIGDTSTGDLDTPVFQSGSVFVYTKEQSQWKLKAQLVAKGRPKYARFGNHVLIENNQQPSVLIRSENDIYRYGLSR